MTRALKGRFIVFFLLVLLGLAGFAAALLLTDPAAAEWYILVGFYTAVFFIVFGLTAGALTALKYVFGSQVELLKSGATVNRQAAFLGLLATLALVFQSLRLLNTFTGILLVATLGVLELYFLSR